MMRWLLALLLILNAATLAWQWDAFTRWGWGPNTAREPERLANQIRPEAVRIETPAAAAQRIATEMATTASPPASEAVAADSASSPSLAPATASSKPTPTSTP